MTFTQFSLAIVHTVLERQSEEPDQEYYTLSVASVPHLMLVAVIEPAERINDEQKTQQVGQRTSQSRRRYSERTISREVDSKLLVTHG